MRSSLFILGIFTATLCVAQPAAAQNYPWCVYENFGGAAPRIAGFQRFNNAWPPGPGTATRVGPIRSTKACRGPAPSSRRARGHSY